MPELFTQSDDYITENYYTLPLLCTTMNCYALGTQQYSAYTPDTSSDTVYGVHIKNRLIIMSAISIGELIYMDLCSTVQNSCFTEACYIKSPVCLEV